MSCNRRDRHKCQDEDLHIEEACECTYGEDLEYSHGMWEIDSRCRALRDKEFHETLENASKQMRQWPMHMRGDGKANGFDKIRNACFDLSEEQLEEIAKYIKKKYRNWRVL